MASFIHMADVHLGFDQYQLTERFIDFGTAFRSAAVEAIERSVDFVLISGDLFNKRAINARTLIQAKKVLGMLGDAGIPVVVIEGNHDMSYYRDRLSWLSFLQHDGLIMLLDPDTDNEGNIVFRPWDEKMRRGGYVEIAGARIFGLGWLGASTETVARAAAGAIEDIETDRGNMFTILMLHAGLEGYVPRMSGCIDAGALAPLRDRVDYVALGHIHKGYEQNEWIFNPGSLETWNISEYRWDRGIYHVGFSSEGMDRAKLINGSSWRRPFDLWDIRLDSAGTPDEAMGRVFDFVGRRKGTTSDGRTAGAYDDTTSVKTEGTLERSSECRLAEGRKGAALVPDQGRIDSYISSGTSAGSDRSTDIEGYINEDDEKENDTNGNMNDKMSECNAGNKDDNKTKALKPIIHLTLTGVLGFDRHQLDTDAIRDHVLRHAEPLHVIVKNDTRSPDFDFEVDATGEISREQLEHGVIRNLIENDDRFADMAETLAALMIDIKERSDSPPGKIVEDIIRWANEAELLDAEKNAGEGNTEEQERNGSHEDNDRSGTADSTR